MGVWRTERGLGGDAWADIMDRALHELEAERLAGGKHEGHDITVQEFADVVEFCSRGHLTVEVSDGADGALPLLALHNAEVTTIGNRGQMHC